MRSPNPRSFTLFRFLPHLFHRLSSSCCRPAYYLATIYKEAGFLPLIFLFLVVSSFYHRGDLLEDVQDLGLISLLLSATVYSNLYYQEIFDCFSTRWFRIFTIIISEKYLFDAQLCRRLCCIIMLNNL